VLREKGDNVLQGGVYDASQRVSAVMGKYGSESSDISRRKNVH